MRALRSEHDETAAAAHGVARSVYLATGKTLPDVRPEIARSWRRSRANGFSPDSEWAPMRVPDPTPLARAFEAELGPRLETLNRQGLAAILVDAAGVVVGRYGIPDGKGTVHLVRFGVVPPLGSSMAEGAIGTHAANLALESVRPEEVVGHEHLHKRYLGTHSVSAPVVSSITQRLLGALVVESTTPPSGMLLPWAVEVAAAIGARLREECTGRETALMREFLSARHQGRHPVICLDQQTLLCNAAAARLLGGGDQALLWEYASRVIKGEAPDTEVLTLGDGTSHVARFELISGQGGPAGVRITLRPSRTRTSNRRRAAVPAPEGALSGHSRRIARLVEELGAAFEHSDRVVLVGEPGTGKRTIARALLPSGALEVDCAREDEVLDLVRGRRSAPRPLIVTHLERLSDAGVAEIARLVSSGHHPAAPMVFTMTPAETEAGALAPGDGGIGARIHVPALRDRLDDLPQLVTALATIDSGDDRPPVRWMPDALQVLARVDWPENLRSLQAVVDSVTRRCTTGYVDSHQLPEGIRARAAGRRLTRLEQLEATEILATLREADGNKFVAARRLGIARSTLYRRLRSLGMDLAAVNY